MTRTVIVLVNWNGWGDTLECLESVFRQVAGDFRVIVCDNGSTDDSCEQLKAWAEGRLDAWIPARHPLRQFSWPPQPKPIAYREYDRTTAERGGLPGSEPPLILIRVGANLGFAAGNNVALRYLLSRGGFDHVWLLNNDTVVAPRALESLLVRMRLRPAAGMCGSTLLRYHAPHLVQLRGGGWYCKWIGLPWHLGQLGRANCRVKEENVERWMSFVSGASLLVSREFLETVGLLSEDYFLYFEETDWALRSASRFTLAYAAESVVYHKIGGSIGTATLPTRQSTLSDYYNVRNRLLFTRKFYPRALPAVRVSLLFAMLLRLICGRRDRAVMIWRLFCGRDSPAPCPGVG